MVFAIGVFGILIVFLLISWFFSRYVTDISSYYVIGRSAGWYTFAATVFATWMSAWALLGGIGYGYTYGPLSVLQFYGSYAGLILMFFFLAPRLRQGGYFTIPDWFGDRFHSDAVRSGAVACLILGIYFYILTQLVGGATLLSRVLDLPYELGLLVFLLVILITLWLSGMWSVVMVDALGVIVFVIAMFGIFPYIVMEAGGWSEFITAGYQHVGDDYWSWTGANGVSPAEWFGNFISWFFIISVSPHILNRSLICKNQKEILKGGLAVMAFSFVWVTLYPMILGGALHFIPHGSVPTDEVAIEVAMNYVPLLFGLIYLMGTFSAATTSANTQVLTCAQGISRDVLQNLIYKQATDQQVIRWTRIAIFAVLITGAIVAFYRPWLLAITGTITGVIFAFGYFPAFVAGFYWKRITAKSIAITLWASIPASLFTVFTWHFYDWWEPHPTIWGVGFGLVVMLVSTYLTQPTQQEIESRERIEKIMKPDKPLYLYEGTRDIVFIGICIAVPIIWFIVLCSWIFGWGPFAI